jgi:hypothetical protein
MTKTTGIMFKAEMILAYLAGIKNQTRRTKGLDKVNQKPDNWELVTVTAYGATFLSRVHKKTHTLFVPLPYGTVGDTLWFKETWRMWERDTDGKDFLHYRADDAKVDPTWWSKEEWTRPDPVWAGRFEKWQPSMLMPQICSRFRNVPILGVRVERLDSIKMADAFCEGIQVPFEKGMLLNSQPRMAYLEYWDMINGNTLPAGGNPWVWVYEFQTHRKEKP